MIEYEIFRPPNLSLENKIYYDKNVPPSYDDCNDNESGFGRVSTLGSNYPTILEGVESYCNNDKSGFGEVITLFSDDSTISEEVSIDYDENKVATYDDYCDDTYVINSRDNYSCETCYNYEYSSTKHYSFNVELIYSIQVLYDTPTIMNEKKLTYVESNNISIMWIMKIMLDVIVILWNLFIMPLKIIMREEHMVLDISTTPSFLSLC